MQYIVKKERERESDVYASCEMHNILYSPTFKVYDPTEFMQMSNDLDLNSRERCLFSRKPSA